MPRAEYDQDAFLRDIVERNLEIIAQCCIDICHRIISITGVQKPADGREAILRMSALGVLPDDFARALAPISGFRNILTHEYLEIDWDEVYRNMQHLDELLQFARYIRSWMQSKQ